MKLARLGVLALLPLAGVIAVACVSEKEPTGDGLGRASAPIIGGVADTTDTFVVGINIGGSGVCSGTLIAPNLVLTARHCVSSTPKTLDCNPDGGLATNKVLGNYAASSFTVSTAQFYRSAPTWGVSAVRYINDATCSTPDVACQLCGYDLALLELKAGTAFPTKTVAPSLVGPKKANYQAMGYGCQKPEPTCGTLGYRMMLDPAAVTAVALQEFLVTGRVCGGDSGGPIYDPATGTIFGALSRGDGPTTTSEGCTMGIYTRADYFLDWLQKYGLVAAKDGGYAPLPWMTATPPPPPPPPDAGPKKDSGPPPPKAGLGAPCTVPSDCVSGLCVGAGGPTLCSQLCTPTEPCPSGYDCLSGYCWPAAPPPPPEDAGLIEDTSSAEDTGGDPLAAPSDTTVKGTCAASRGPTAPGSPWVAAFVGLGLIALGRRRRRG